MGYSCRYEVETRGAEFSTLERKELADLKIEANRLSGKLRTMALAGIAAKEKTLKDNPVELITQYLGFNPFCGDYKWYERDLNMGSFSEKHPQTIFIITALGEDGERFRTYYFNGRKQDANAIITYEEFDTTKLVPISRC